MPKKTSPSKNESKKATSKKRVTKKTTRSTTANKKPRKKAAQQLTHHHRPIWKGYISFGLVNIPVVLYSGENAKEEIHFKMLDKTNLSTIKYTRVNAETGKEVPWQNIVKGYPDESGNYVVITEEDLQSVAIENQKTITIEDFIAKSSLPSMYFLKPYYLLPDKRGEKGYLLLHHILQKTGKIGIARVMVHSHQYLAAIMPYGDAIIINTLRYPEEVHIPTQIDSINDRAAVKISTKELDIAEQLVNTMSSKWDPKRYTNFYREEVMKLVETKLKAHKKGTIKPIKTPTVKQTNVIDFMELLKKSVKQRKK